MHANQSDQSSSKELRRQPHRIYMAGLVVFNMVVESVMLALFAVAGTIPLRTALWFFVIGMTTSLAIYAFFKLGYNLRLKDKGLLVPQLVINGLIQFAFMMIAPKLTILFLLVVLAYSGYAAPEFTPRQFTLGWLVYGAGTALAIWLSADRFGYPGVSGAETALVWLFFFLALRSLTLASARFSRLREKLSDKNRQLEESLRHIEKLASHDHLTGVFNRGYFLDMLASELKRSERSGAPFCFVMLDLDHFKAVNDTYGHPVGDQVLKAVCDILLRALRAVDRAGRVGGEEFGVLLPDTAVEEGLVSVERLRQAVAEYDWESIAPGLRVCLSAGLASYIPGDTIQAITKRADDALYRAKQTGRNRVVVAETEHGKAARNLRGERECHPLSS